jgi:hypothetical protein
MDYDQQRALAVRLAQAGGAKWQKTQATLANDNSCFSDIVKTAVAEVGVDALVSQILQGPPQWAYNTLRLVPNLGSHRDALFQKAAEEPEWALHALRFVPDLGSHGNTLAQKAGTLAQSIVGPIVAMTLKNSGSYVCQWTLKWTNAGKTQPAAGYPNWGDWYWSGRLDVGGSQSIDLSAFAKDKAPLQAGNVVWMYVWVQAGDDMESPVQFTYDPASPVTANFVSSGCTKSDDLGYRGNTP